jgi:hypothetical protein
MLEIIARGRSPALTATKTTTFTTTTAFSPSATFSTTTATSRGLISASAPPTSLATAAAGILIPWIFT